MRRSLFALIGALVISLAVTVPAEAQGRPDPWVGEQMQLFGPGGIDAGEPFHIRHGWGLLQGAPAGVFLFTLEHNGSLLRPDAIVTTLVDHPELGRNLQRVWVFNFPEGLSGEHTFTGTWSAPCQEVVDSGDYPGPCDTPNEQVVVQVITVTVKFCPAEGLGILALC